MDSDHRPNDTYVSRMPAPPKIQLLPPISSSNCGLDPSINLSRPAFLRNVDLRSCLDSPEKQAVTWSYSLRYEAQQILPFLYLGPSSAAKNQTFLESQHITMVLNVRHGKALDAKPLQGVFTGTQKLGINTIVFNVRSNQSLISTLPRAIRTVNEHLDECNANSTPSYPKDIVGSVFVCCDSGNDRAAAVIIAYIMETFGLDLLQAHRTVQNHRFCIAIDEPMRQTLQSYEDIVKARRDVEKSRNPGDSSSTETQAHNDTPQNNSWNSRLHPKRSRELESDDEMDDADDRERFEGRGFSPFQA